MGKKKNKTNNENKSHKKHQIEEKTPVEKEPQKTPEGNHVEGISRWIRYIPLIVILGGVLFRILLMIPADPVGTEALKTWFFQVKELVYEQHLSFRSLYSHNATTTLPPFYAYVSWFLIFVFNLCQVLVKVLGLGWATDNVLYSVILKLPAIFADLGIGLILYFWGKKTFNDNNRGALLSGLYLWNPGVILGTLRRPQTLSLAILFILISVLLMECKGRFPLLKGALSGLFFAMAVLTYFNPLLIIPFVVWVIFRSMGKKEFIKGGLTLLVLAISFFLLTAPFHDFKFTPPADTLESLMSNNQSSDNFYPFKTIYRNTFDYYDFNTLSAFNVWCFQGLWQKDDVVSLQIGSLKITRFGLGLLISIFSLFVILAFYALRKKKEIEDSLVYFTLIFFLLFIFPTRGKDEILLGVIPLLTMLFLSDYRLRVGWYIISITSLLNFYYKDHFYLGLDSSTTLPAQMMMIAGINIIIFIGGIYYFYKTADEKSITDEGNNLKTWLMEKLPTLQKCQDWLLIKENQYLLILLAFSFLIRMWRIWIPDSINFDEKYYVPMAYEYYLGVSQQVHGASHPPLATYLIGLGIGFFGNNVFGWRIVSFVFSLAMILVAYYFAKGVFKNSFPALISAFLLSLDFLHFVHSRLGMLDMYSSFFNLCSYYLFFLYAEKGKEKHLWGLGATLALGLACKWTTAFTIVGITCLFGASKIAGFIFKEKFEFGQNLAKFPWLKVIAVLMLIPLIFQYISYLPLLGSVSAVTMKIQDLLKYHEMLIGEDKISSPWWSWLFIINPIQYIRGQVGKPKVINIPGMQIIKLKETDADVQFAVTGMGNPAVWWFSIPAFFGCLFIAYRKKDYRALFIAMPFIFQYLPWAFANRITYIFYMLDIVPYISLITAYCLYNIYLKGKIGRFITWGYLGLVAISFAVFYPLLSAWSLPAEIYKLYRIFDFWRIE